MVAATRAQAVNDEVLAWIQTRPDVHVPPQLELAGERRRGAEALAAMAGGRAPLEAVRSAFIHRLHRASDDFEATEGLRVVEAALSLIPWPEQPAGRDGRRRPPRRWFRRRESPR
jgi:hypothetical protein